MIRILTFVSICFCLVVTCNGQLSGQVQKSPHDKTVEIDGDQESESTGFDISGIWQLEWDDAIDGKLDADLKKCNIEFSMTDSRFEGHFMGAVAGTFRDAKITGKVIDQKVPLLQFVQREADYSCAYQIYWNPGPDRLPRGVWHDSNGASGEFTLLKNQ